MKKIQKERKKTEQTVQQIEERSNWKLIGNPIFIAIVNIILYSSGAKILTFPSRKSKPTNT
jgi:hypothetical protein